MKNDNDVLKILREWNEFQGILSRISDDKAKLPIAVEGLQGSLAAFFTAEYVRKRKYNAIHSLQ